MEPRPEIILQLARLSYEECLTNLVDFDWLFAAGHRPIFRGNGRVVISLCKKEGNGTLKQCIRDGKSYLALQVDACNGPVEVFRDNSSPASMFAAGPMTV
jgi:hypothetical protein